MLRIIVYISTFLVVLIIIGIVFVTFTKKVKINGVIKTGLAFIVLGLYPILDGIWNNNFGDVYSVALKLSFIVFGLLIIFGYFLVGFVKYARHHMHDDKQAVLTSEWASLNDEMPPR